MTRRLDSQKGPLRKVVRFGPHPLIDGARVEFLECGHYHAQGEIGDCPQRRRCWKCWRGLPMDFIDSAPEGAARE